MEEPWGGVRVDNDKRPKEPILNEEISKRPWWNRTVMGFSLASLFSDLGHEWVTSLTPGFLTMIGAPPIALGLVEGVSGVGQSLAGLWGGRKADTASHRMLYIAVGYLATILKALYGLVWFWPWLILIRTVAWIGRGMRGPLRDTLIAESVPANAYGRALGIRESLDTVGGIAGPILGAVLLARVGYRSLFLWTAVPGFLAFFSVIALVRDRRMQVSNPEGETTTRTNVDAAESTHTVTSGTIHYPSAFKRLLVVDTLFSVGNVVPSFFILVVVQDLKPVLGAVHASVLGIILYAWYNLVYALTTLVAGSLTDRSGPRPVLISGFFACLLSLVGFAFLPATVVVDTILFTLAGVATGTLESSQKTYVRLVLPQYIRGRGLGLHASWIGFGTLASGILIGGLWTIGDQSWGFAATAAVVLLALILLVTTVPTVRAKAD